jgi:hypothetical protein
MMKYHVRAMDWRADEVEIKVKSVSGKNRDSLCFELTEKVESITREHRGEGHSRPQCLDMLECLSNLSLGLFTSPFTFLSMALIVTNLIG